MSLRNDMNKNLWIIFIVALGAIAIVWVAANRLKETPGNPPIVSTPSSTQPVATTTISTPTSSWKTFASGEENYTLHYPADFTVEPYTDLTAFQLPSGALFTYPDHFSSGTNLREAKIGIARKETNSRQDCSSKLVNSHGLKEVTIDGVTFFRAEGNEGAAGNIYETVGYAARAGDFCYNFILFMHSVNRDNFDRASTPREFDRASVVNLFDQIMATVRFSP